MFPVYLPLIAMPKIYILANISCWVKFALVKSYKIRSELGYFIMFKLGSSCIILVIDKID